MSGEYMLRHTFFSRAVAPSHAAKPFMCTPALSSSTPSPQRRYALACLRQRPTASPDGYLEGGDDQQDQKGAAVSKRRWGVEPACKNKATMSADRRPVSCRAANHGCPEPAARQSPLKLTTKFCGGLERLCGNTTRWKAPPAGRPSFAAAGGRATMILRLQKHTEIGMSVTR